MSEPPPLKRVEELFHRAVALPPDDRAAFLREACGGDAELRAAVEALLRHDADGTDVLNAGPLAREAALARQLAPTLRVPGSGPPPPAELPAVPGYEMLRVLGRGGMGVVYLARHTALKRLVALKMLSISPATAEQLARFRAEAEALARLQHPNIVPIYDVGEWQGHPFFTMEYVDGPSLAAVLDGRPQDADDAARLVEVLARAVHAVHQCGIVHRDIKPANVLLSFSGRPRGGASDAPPRGRPLNEAVPKLTDFGIAKDRSSERRLTQDGMILGTPSYMAPEQVRATRGGVGPAADIYALGSIFYEMLTGRPPFDSATPVEIIAQLINQEPLSPRRLRPRLPADLATICLRCLEKSPRRRYASAEELAEDLRRFLAREPILARPVGPLGHAYRWCLRHPLVAGLAGLSSVLAAALVVSLLLLYVRLREEVRVERREIVELNVTIALQDMEEGETFAAVLRFSEALRLEEDVTYTPSLRAQIASALRRAPRLLRMWARDGRVVCSRLGPSAGQVVTARADHSLEVWDVHTGRTTGPALQENEEVSGGALSPDGQSLATVSAGGTVRVWEVQTGRSRTLREVEAVVRVAFLPGGRTLLTWHANASVRLWDLRPDDPVPLPGRWEGAAALSDDGRRLFVVSGDHKGQVWDLETGKADGPPLELKQAPSRAELSADGRRLVLLGPGGGVRVRDVAAGTWFDIPGPPRPAVSDVAISPDGERVVTAGGDRTIRVWQVAVGGLLEIRTRGGPVTDVRFSTDGRLVIAGDGNVERVWNAENGDAVTPPLRQGSPIAGASCGADSSEVVTLGHGGIVCVWELPHPGEVGGAPSPEEVIVASGSVDSILAVARLLAACRINREQQREPLDAKSLRDAWKAVHPDE